MIFKFLEMFPRSVFLVLRGPWPRFDGILPSYLDFAGISTSEAARRQMSLLSRQETAEEDNKMLSKCLATDF